MEHKPEKMSDEELYKLLKTDDEAIEFVFTEFYNRYASRVYAFCKRFLGNTDVAKDIFQESFIRFHKTLIEKRSLSNTLGFLLKIVRNLCLNEIRRTSSKVEFEEYKNVIFDNRTENDELLDLIKRSIELLPDEYREMFILREYDGMSYNEIAEITQTNINTVKVKLFRAKKMLRQILEPYLTDYDFGNNM